MYIVLAESSLDSGIYKTHNMCSLFNASLPLSHSTLNTYEKLMICVWRECANMQARFTNLLSHDMISNTIR